MRQGNLLQVNKWVALKGGHTNEIFKVKHKEDYVVLRTSKRPLKELEYEFNLHKYLCENGLLTPSPILFDNNHKVGTINFKNTEKNAIMLSFIDGRYPNLFSKSDLTRVGQALALLHMVKPPHFAKSGSGASLNRIKNNYSCIDFLQKYVSFDIKFLVEELSKDIINTELALCHGDLFWNNTLINEVGLYLLDLEGMGVDYKILDLAKMIYGFVTPRNTHINLSSAYSILEGYNHIFKVDSKKLDLIKKAICISGVQISIWRYNYYRLNPFTDIKKDSWIESMKAAENWLNIELF